MKITIWTLASDDDNGTRASVFTTRHGAEEAYFEAIFTEEGPTQREARKALEEADYDELHDIAEKYLEGGLDTYSIDSQEVEVAASEGAPVAQCVPEDELAAEQAALSPEDKAALAALPTDDDKPEFTDEQYIQLARAFYEDEDISIDNTPKPIVSRNNDGAHVAGWLWVSNDDLRGE